MFAFLEKGKLYQDKENMLKNEWKPSYHKLLFGILWLTQRISMQSSIEIIYRYLIFFNSTLIEVNCMRQLIGVIRDYHN